MSSIEVAGGIGLRKSRPTQGCRADDDDRVIVWQATSMKLIDFKASCCKSAIINP
jgi:hypothetical protein